MRLRTQPIAALVLGVLALPVPAAAQAGGAPSPSPTGGAEYSAPLSKAKPSNAERPVASEFSVAPRAVTLGGRPARISFRIDDPLSRTVRVRLAFVRVGERRPTARLDLGRRPTGRVVTVTWPGTGAGAVPAGEYVVRLHAVDERGLRLLRGARSSGRATLTVRPKAEPKPEPGPDPVPDPTPPAGPAPPTVSGRFPIAGPYDFGGDEARFGAARTGHTHQGQDITAKEGTPVLAPTAGTVMWRAYQEDGAGYYLVIRGDGAARDYVFMHLREDSLLVGKGDRVGAGQRVAEVGNTGRSFGAHLHFEIWEGGWYTDDGRPVDPRPQLERWAAGR